MSHSPTSLSELLDQRDEDLVALIDRTMQDAAAMNVDLQHGNVEAARHMLAAIGFQLIEMRGLLP